MITVVGDVMLDVYVEGVVKRMSPEAPVPVFLETGRKHFTGGAANVARNIRTLGAHCSVFSVVGADKEGEDVARRLFNIEILLGLLRALHRPTTVKTRYVAGGQQIMRVDRETTDDISAEIEVTLICNIKSAVKYSKVVVISDYAKGVLTPSVLQKTIQAGRDEGVPVIVDPKGTDFRKYRGATILKPNAEELSKATGLPTNTKEECIAAIGVLQEITGVKSVLVTRASNGMLLYTNGEFFEDKAHAVEVADVVGAGDTALAAFAVALAEGSSYASAMRFANMASSIVVGRHGTATVTREEVDNAFVRT